MTFTANSFVKWTGTDAEGTFSHTGRVIKDDGHVICLETSLGEMVVTRDGGNTFKRARATKINRTTTTTTTPAKKTTTTTTLRSGSVKEAVFNLLKGKTVTRKEAIELIVSAGLSTAAGASTHYNSVKDII